MRVRTDKKTDAGETTRERETQWAGMICGTCGLEITTLALRCPRCLAPLPLGCDGNCRDCGKKSCS